MYTQLRERNCTSYLRWAVPPPPLLLLLLACCCRHNKWQRFLERAVGSRRFSCSPKVSLEKKFIWHLEKSKEEFLFTNTVGDRGYIDDQKKTIEITGIYYLCIHISILNCWWWLTLRGAQPFFFSFWFVNAMSFCIHFLVCLYSAAVLLYYIPVSGGSTKNWF